MTISTQHPSADASTSTLKATGFSQIVRKALGHFDEAGRLQRLASKLSIQQMTVWGLWTYFESDRIYTEKEVNTLLNKKHTFGDQSTLRRELINMQLLARKSDCSEYWKVSKIPDGETEIFLNELTKRVNLKTR